MSITMSHALEVFTSTLTSQQRAQRTVENYTGAVRRLDHELGGLLGPPDHVASSLKRWRCDLQQRYDHGRISASKIRTDLAALRAFYKALKQEGLYPVNPASSIRSLPMKIGLPRPMSQSDVEQLFAQVQVFQNGSLEGRRDLALLEMFRHGLRRNEVCGLDTSHLQYHAAKETLILQFRGKGNKERIVPLNPTAAQWLACLLLMTHEPDEWKTWVAEFQDAAHPTLLAVDRLLRRKLKGSKFLVFTHLDNPLCVRRANRIFAKYRDAAKISKSYGPHSLRHTFATQMLSQGVDLMTLKDLMGHVNIATTQIYTQVQLGPKAAATRRMPSPVPFRMEA